MTLLHAIKKIVPRRVFHALQPSYHYVMAWCAAAVYGFPSRRIRVVGVTGTTGKTSVVAIAAQAMRAGGLRVGYTSTALFSDGARDWLNDKKMTMVGRFFTQKMLRAMVRNGCDVAIVETTSEGAVQFRHRFINYDVMLMTGLYPEHIESHGGFDNYKRAKQSLFTHLWRSRCKRLAGVHLPKTAIINCDDAHAHDFCILPPANTIGFASQPDACAACAERTVTYRAMGASARGVQMRFDTYDVQLAILGTFNATNAAAAGCICMACGMDAGATAHALEQVRHIPGRIERSEEGQDFTVIVDYAFEPHAVEKLYETIMALSPRRIIHVLGSAGGGRDRARRHALGLLAGSHADTVIVTDEDSYDDDPHVIMQEVARGAQDGGKRLGQDVIIVADRGEAIARAVATARTGDVVLITGKGCEQAIAGPNGLLTPWDDRTAVRDALRRTIQTASSTRSDAR